MKRLYLATLNDGLFIIDQPPRPSHDTKADVPDVNVIAKITGNSAGHQEVAERMVSAFNATLGSFRTHSDIARENCAP